MIVVNSLEILEEFDKKSSIYSQRPYLPMGGELVGYDRALVLMPYGNRFRHYRKQFARYIGNNVIEEQHDLVDGYTKLFLRRVVKDSTDLMGHIRKYVMPLSLPALSSQHSLGSLVESFFALLMDMRCSWKATTRSST